MSDKFREAMEEARQNDIRREAAMHLRDRFAMAALTGLLASAKTFRFVEQGQSRDVSLVEVPEMAYRLADRMVEARVLKKQEGG